MKRGLILALSTVLLLAMATPAFARNHKHHKRHHRHHHQQQYQHR